MNTKLRLLDLRIVGLLFSNKEGMTIKAIADRLKVDYKNMYDAIDKLQGIVDKKKVGNYNICKLNYANEEIIEYLKEYNYYFKVREFKKKRPTEYRILIETIERFIDDKNRMPLFVFLIFGSYAKGKETKESDIDLLLLEGFAGSYSSFERILNNVNLPYKKKLHLTHQFIGDFIKDLKNKKKLSVATEIYNELPIVIYGDDSIFRIFLNHSKLW